MDASGPDGSPIRITLWLLAWEPEMLWVNKNGRRFIDEGYQLAFFASETPFHCSRTASPTRFLTTPLCAKLRRKD